MLAVDGVRVTFVGTSPTPPQRRLDKTKLQVLGWALGRASLPGRSGQWNSLLSLGVRWGRVFPTGKESRRPRGSGCESQGPEEEGTLARGASPES